MFLPGDSVLVTHHRLDHPQLIQTSLAVLALLPCSFIMSWSKNSWSSGWNQSSWSPSDWRSGGSRESPQKWQSQTSIAPQPVPTPSTFTPSSECYDETLVGGKKFFRCVQNTPWSSKTNLAGKDVSEIRLVDMTRKGLDEFALRNLSNREFQGLVFTRSVSEAVFVSNLLRQVRSEKLDLDGIAQHIHGAACPDKHKNSAAFIQPLVHEATQAIKAKAPPPAVAASSSVPEETQAELARAKRKLEEAGLTLTPQKKNRASEASQETPGSSSKLPVAPPGDEATAIFERSLPKPLLAFPIVLAPPKP